ncbi:S26 family signal peptidase [Endozoicomonas sp. ONNA1]|uniref:S26 family signal peptidase n=1 Tax=Endozoicomonas sp. ONNA1 TaxID=2828740 RepID=UPI0021485AD5|nr:S26 family signal peptidase [Endozoicomonas sp. ONNA1]
MNKKLVKKVAAICLFALPLLYLFPNIIIVTSRSIDKRVLWITDAEPEKGDYVLFELAHELVGDAPVKITKQIGCYAGDILTVNNRSYYCNDEYLGYAKSKGLKGQPLPQFEFNGVIPDGMAFAYGSDKDSFDSKYWGFLNLENATKLEALF